MLDQKILYRKLVICVKLMNLSKQQNHRNAVTWSVIILMKLTNEGGGSNEIYKFLLSLI